jgi:hypothetical protein
VGTTGDVLVCALTFFVSLLFLLQASIPEGAGQLNAVLYFDGIQQDETGFVSVDGGIVLGGFFRKGAREKNEAMRSICSFIQVVPAPFVLIA